LKIAIWHNLGSGGAKRALYSHVKALRENGYYLEAWTTDISSADFLPLSELITENRKPLKSDYERVCKIKNPIIRENRLIKLLDNHYRECADEIESGGFDILFAASCTVTYMPYIGEFLVLPKILYLGEPYRIFHEAIPENVWQAPYRIFKVKKIKRIFYDFLLNYSRRIKLRKEVDAAKSYDRILVNSLFSRESVMRAYGIDSNVCYLGIDTKKFVAENIIKEPYVACLGTVSRIKAVHRVIEIIGEIPEAERPELKWVANGSDSYYMDEMINLARVKKVNLKFYINIPDSELIGILSRAAVMLYTPVLEPFGLAPLEANACGTYVVAIAEGGVRESILDGTNGTLVKGYRISEIASIVRAFVLDLEMSTVKGHDARNHVNLHWNMQGLSKNIVSEIKEFISLTTQKYYN
jgi:glycosyltransferase involved in cell wall biosynthesis